MPISTKTPVTSRNVVSSRNVVTSRSVISQRIFTPDTLLRTGQTTQYSGELDDGYYEKGLAKAYTIKTTGPYSGTSNIDLIHLTDTTIAFAATTPGTITDSNNGLAIFKTGDVLIVTGSVSNNGTYNISTGNVAGTIRTTEATVFEAATPSVSLAKREALSNNCVLDMNTGLMWARYTSAENAAMGAASDGKMPWMGKLFDVFQWCAAVNAAALGGYSDWRVPNAFELVSLANIEPPDALPDKTAFPSWYVLQGWSSTTMPDDTDQALYMIFSTIGRLSNDAKTASHFVTLVRGGV